MDKKIKILLITVGTIFLIGFVLFLLFGWTTINVEPATAKIKLDKSEITSGYKGFLFIGKHKLIITSTNSYYQSLEQDINIKPGSNKVAITLLNKRDVFIKELPIYADAYDISYSPSQDRFFITINVDPVDGNKAEALKFLKSKGVDTTKENIIWNIVAGVGDKVGP